MTIEETLQLVRAGFTADQIQQLMQQGQTNAPAPVTPPVIPQAPAPTQQTDPAPAPTPEPDPEPDETNPEKKEPENKLDPAIQKILDDQAAQIANLQQIIANSNNMGGLARQETDPMAYLVKSFSNKK